MAARPGSRARALALGLALSAALAAPWPTSARPVPWGQAGDEIDHDASVNLTMMPAGLRCTATAAPGGWYFPMHCLTLGAPLLPDGITRAWSTDPTRDLAHIASATAPIGPTLGAAVVGDVLTWRNARGWGAVRVVGERTLGHWPWEGSLLIAACHVAGLAFIRGDSGTGMHRATDGAGGPEGALVGLFVGGELDPAPGTVEYLQDYDQWCGAGQSTLVQAVP